METFWWLLAKFIVFNLAAQGFCSMILAGFTPHKAQRNVLWAVSALFWIAAGIWRLK